MQKKPHTDFLLYTIGNVYPVFFASDVTYCLNE